VTFVAIADEPQTHVLLGAATESNAVTIGREKSDTAQLDHVKITKTPIELTGGTSERAHVTRLAIPTGLTFSWRIAFGCVWGGGNGINFHPEAMFRVPVNEMALFDSGRGRPIKELAQRYPYAHRTGILGIYDWYPSPIRSAYAKYRQKEWEAAGNFGGATGGTGPYPPIEKSHYDFLPIARESILLFIMYHGEISVWRGDGKWEQAREAWAVQWSEKPTEEFKTEITEPFWVAGNEKQYLFVTRSGALYTASKDEDGKRKAEPAWRMGSQPIVAVITDVDTNRYFAFTKPRWDVKLDGKPVYFELGPDPKPEVYDRDAILKDAKDDPAVVTALARFLVDQKKITLKK
jgi:hypothetical protein